MNFLMIIWYFFIQIFFENYDLILILVGWRKLRKNKWDTDCMNEILVFMDNFCIIIGEMSR